MHKSVYNNVNRTLRQFPLFLIFLMFLLMASLSIAQEKLHGTWAGASGSQKDGPRVELSITASDGSMYYGSPKNCTVEFEPPTIHTSQKFKAAIESSTGGSCDELWEGGIHIKKIDDSNISYEVQNKDGKICDRGTLQSE